MNKNKTADKDDAREFVKEALTLYAAFFAAIAHSDETGSVAHLSKVKEVDAKAAAALSPANFDFYRERRSELMRLFRKRLIEELQGEVEADLIRRAQELIDKY